MGDIRYKSHFTRLRRAENPLAALRGFTDEEVISALAAAVDEESPYLANVLATEAMNRIRQKGVILDHLGEGVILMTPEGRVTYANRPAAEILGWDREALEGGDMHETFHRNAPDGIRCDQGACPLLEAAALGESLKGEDERFSRADGSHVPVVFTLTPVTREGDAVGSVLVFRDISVRRLMEERLRERERFLTTLLGNLPGMVYRGLNEPDWRMEFVSEGAVAVTGYAPEDLVIGGRVTYGDLIHPDDHPRIWDQVQAAVARAMPFRLTYRIRDAAGRERWVRERGRGVEGSDARDGKLRVEGFIADITDMRFAEEALRESEERNRIVAESANEGIVLHRGGRILAANPAAARMHGYTPEELTGRDVRTLAPPEARARIEQAIEAGEEVPYETVGMRRDGTRFPIEVRARTTTMHGERVRVAVLRDLTHEKRERQAIREAAETLQATIDAIPCNIAVLDSDGTILAVNARWREFGLENGLRDPACSVGRNYLEVCEQATGEGAAEAHEVAQGIRDVAAGHRRIVAVLYPCHSPRERRWFNANLTRFVMGDKVRVVVTHTDVTATKEAEDRHRRLSEALERKVAERTRALRQANRDLEAFASSVAHDLRAPLRALEYLEDALVESEGTKLDREGADILARVKRETLRMREMVEDLLALSREGRAPVDRERTDLTAMAEEILATLRQESPDRLVHVAVAPGLVASGDASLLRVALANLLENAWKFTSREPEARIEVGRAATGDGSEAFFVRDNGTGFDMAEAERLFQPFERLRSARDYPGTGVGLATVQRIIQRHGGRVWAESRPGEGATFYFTLE